MLKITIKRDYFAYIDVEGDDKLFYLLKKSFTRTVREFNNFYRMYETKNKILYSVVNNGTIIKVKAGLIPFLCNSLYMKHIKYDLIDERLKLDKHIDIVTQLSEEIKLRPYQQQSVIEIFNNPFSCVQLPTGTGKTEISASVIKSYLNTYKDEAFVYLTPVVMLQNEAKERFKKYGIEVNTKLPIQVGKVNIFTYALITRADNTKLDYKQRDSVGAIIIDEAHHLSAEKLSKQIHRFSNLRLSVGMSATPSTDLDKKRFLKELNVKEFSVYGCTGKPVYRMEIEDSIKNNFVVPIEVRVFTYKSKHCLGEDENDWHLIKNVILKDKDRAQQVAKYTKHIFDNANLNTIALLIPEVEWSQLYMTEMVNVFENNKDNVRIFQMYGGGVIYEYNVAKNDFVKLDDDQKAEALSAIRNPNIRTIFSATTFFFEGIDITSIQAIINCYGGRDSKRIKQQAGGW